ncbi:heavy metal-(Cd/Co/Hg/Pb/Zn)-translocating P-type ATPase [Microbacterium sp. AG1240]|uniref:heavy metal translocating P-type ATPase n=1 Tax=Microbacterium sp. AG1240 TaxID=2183992 RepID=UPI000F1DE9B3|nr:heavy metal translocating P-type ATPase [Microbacterium sp. AG1240]RKT31102.1 heavy metal-(Cd/Co/Hg/Pb/Zn)-translocating P-type ATPase [Microbacterium sp. AG1240]
MTRPARILLPTLAGTAVVLGGVLVLTVIGRDDIARWSATAWVGAFIAWTLVGMVRDVLAGHVGLDLLAVVAMVSTLAVGEYVASLIVVLMLSGGQALEQYATRRAKRDLTSLLDRSPRRAHVLVRPDDAGSAETREVAVADVRVGDILLIRPSEIVPVDGVLLSSDGTFDESSLTGESLPVARVRGDHVLSGVVNGSGAVRVHAERTSERSQYQQIVALVESAQSSRAPVVRLADRFAIPFTAVALVLAGGAWIVSGLPERFAEVLVLATPCPLLIAAPVAFLGGLSRSAKTGVIVKGGGVIEQLARVRSAAFDKTGTLTQGRPRLTEVRPAWPFDADELLRLAASAEQYSTHVFADTIRREAVDRGLTLRAADRAEEVATLGVTAMIGGREVVVGKPGFVAGVAPETVPITLHGGEAAAYVAVDGCFAGVLVLADPARPESAEVVRWLREHGVENIVMLTGDGPSTAAAIARRVGIDVVHSDLLPGQKVVYAAGMVPRPLMMVGDGINDAPVLAAADIGVAMGARGATAAGDAADVVVLVDSLTKVAEAVAIGRHTLRVAVTAIWIGIGLSTALMIIATSGAIPAVAGALIQELVDVATILYALRALGGPSSRTAGLSARERVVVGATIGAGDPSRTTRRQE